MRTIDHQNLHGEYEEREAEQMKMSVGCESYLEELLDETGKKVQNHLNSDKSGWQ